VDIFRTSGLRWACPDGGGRGLPCTQLADQSTLRRDKPDGGGGSKNRPLTGPAALPPDKTHRGHPKQGYLEQPTTPPPPRGEEGRSAEFPVASSPPRVTMRAGIVWRSGCTKREPACCSAMARTA